MKLLITNEELEMEVEEMGRFGKLLWPEKYEVYVIDKGSRKFEMEVDDKLEAWALLGFFISSGA